MWTFIISSKKQTKRSSGMAKKGIALQKVKEAHFVYFSFPITISFPCYLLCTAFLLYHFHFLSPSLFLFLAEAIKNPPLPVHFQHLFRLSSNACWRATSRSAGAAVLIKSNMGIMRNGAGRTLNDRLKKR